MNWLDKLERKLGRYAIPNLTVYLLAGYVIGFAVMNFMPSLLNWLTLEPGLVIRGQVWRIISWVLIPPSTNLISLIFLVLLYYSLGSALERTWGTFRYNVYIFSGILFTVVAAFLLYGALYLIYGVEFSLSSVGLISTNYITMSIFLAFAAIYPDMEVLLYFHPADQDEMDGARVRGDGCLLLHSGRTRDARCDRGVASEFCHFLPVRQEYEAVRASRAGAEGEVRESSRDLT